MTQLKIQIIMPEWDNFLSIIKIVEVDVMSGNGHLELLK